MKRLATLVLSLSLFVAGCQQQTDPELVESVQQSIEAKMAPAFSERGIEVQGLELEHQKAERYRGALQVLEQGSAKQYEVEVQFDGTYFIWKLPGWEE